MQKTTKGVFLSLGLLLSIGVGRVSASCSVSGSTLYPIPYSNNQITLNVVNTGNSPISWINVPVGFTSSWMNVTLDIPSGGWEQSIGGSGMVFVGGNLAPGDSVSINATGNTGAQGENIYWGLSTSLNNDGSESEACNTLEFLITNFPPVPTPAPTATPAPATPVLSALSVTVGATSATVSWRSDVSATGMVNYGISSEYDLVAQGEGEVYSHSILLAGLTPSTTYHFTVSSTSENGTTTSNDNSFTTGIEGTNTVVTTTNTITNTVTTTNTHTQTVNQTVVLADTVKPVVKIDTKLDKPLTEPPIIEGKVVDAGAINVGVVKIQYSSDNGKSWLLVDEPSGASKVNFSFVPEIFDDGNYPILVRAIDKSGNVGVSSIATLIIDRLPPRIIHSLWRVGPIVLSEPYQLVAGMKTQVSVQAIGGVTEMVLRIMNDEFKLVKNFETGLWEGEIKLVESEKLQGESVPVMVWARDGGGNEIMEIVGNVNIRASHVSPLQESETTIYRYDELIHRFKIWNGEVYGQTNPSTGKSSWYLPAGKYYIGGKRSGYKSAQTEIFDLGKSGVVEISGYLDKWQWNNWWKRGELTVNHKSQILQFSNGDKLVGKQITWLENTEWRGKEVQMVVVPLWEPRLSEILSGLGGDAVVVIPGANKSSVDLLQQRGGYAMKMVADPDGEILKDFSGDTLPLNLSINRRGQVEGVQ